MLGSEWGRVVILMLLTGTFKRAIDDKHRVAIPKRFRDSFSREFSGSPTEKGRAETTDGTEKGEATDGAATLLYVAPGTDGSLCIYTEESFTRIADQLDAKPSTSKEVRAFSRLFFSRAESLDIDKQGRIRIPAELAQWAEISGEVMLIGVRDRMELWNLNRWETYVRDAEQNYDNLAEQALAKEG